MSAMHHHIALFLDFENLYSTLKRVSSRGIGDFGASPKIDFEYLVEYIHLNYGILEPEDFVVAANFSHYNSQLGGLNRYATTLEMDSFEPREIRKQTQRSPGKKHVIRNYADMALAFEAGRHIETRAADFYLFITGDGAFAAVATRIRENYKKQVEFILPDPDSAHLLQELFPCRSFSEFQPVPETHAVTAEEEPDEEPEPTRLFKDLLDTLVFLRRELSTAIPADLIKAILGPSTSQRLLGHAQSEKLIDIWENETGQACVSLREERVVGNIVKMGTRPVVQVASRVLYISAAASEQLNQPMSRANWRKRLKTDGDFSNAEAKFWLEQLFSHHILKDGHSELGQLKPEEVADFIRTAEKKLHK
ncbi:MAG: NYN domain-containing protein [Anaerolineaceae bacterium]|nr:NYN domain-containing protein [Anaerolineaceae bacterium]